jgi:bacterioferritin-associated ferredoxin
MTDKQIVEAICTTAERLMKEHGLSQLAACRMAARAVLRAAGKRIPAGLGEGEAPKVLAEIQAAGDLAPVKALRDAISPWLWVSSLIGFAMGIMNTRRIGLMYSKWKRSRAAR